MIITSNKIDPKALEARTGWAIKPEGACKGDICVPLPDNALQGGLLEIDVLSERLGMPIATDETTGARALGPESIMGHALTSAESPEIVLPDHKGNEFRLSSLRGQKVLMVSWASW
jgi:hypothetical protein